MWASRCLREKFPHTWSVWEMKIIKCAINQKVTIWEWWKWSRKLLLGYLSTLVRSKVKASFWPWIPSTWQLASAEKGGPISLTFQNNQKRFHLCDCFVWQYESCRIFRTSFTEVSFRIIIKISPFLWRK